MKKISTKKENIMFVGRNEEKNAILSSIKKSNNHVLIYGNRRIGKSFLIDEVLKSSTFEYAHFECAKAPLKTNLDELSSLLSMRHIIATDIKFDSFKSLFTYLNTLNKRIIIALDEFPYLYVKNNKDELESLFQNLLSNYSKNLNIIISGSNIGMMNALLKDKNPLYGRFKTIIHLKEFNYLDASKFYPHLSNYDKVAFYATFGGSPYVLCQLDENKSLKENICSTLLNNFSSIYNYASENYTSDLSSKSNFENIFKIIGNGKVKYKKLEDELLYKQNGLLNKQLNNLIEMGFIEKK